MRDSASGEEGRPLNERVAAALQRAVGRHGLALGAILLVAAGVFGNALFVHPLDPDNMVALSVGPLHHPWDYFSGAAHTLRRPFYRPAAELTLWLQYHVLHLQTHSYFAVNIGIWVVCAWLSYAYVAVATGSRVLGSLAALAAMLDGRAILATLWILERQSTIALACGLGALLLALVPMRRRRLLGASIFALLLVAALAKEFGLAFAVAVPLLAYLQRLDWKPVAVAAAAAVGLYAVLRFGVAGGAAGQLCDQMGYFRHTRTVCYSQTPFSNVKQQVYNAVASFVGTFLPPLFNPDGGLLTPSVRGLVVPVIVSAAAVVGFVRRPRWSLPLLVLVAVNALLNFVLYRSRNQVIGLTALYAAAAIGLEWLYVRVAAQAGRRAFLVAGVGGAVAVFWLAEQAVLRPRTVQNFQRVAAASDPCEVLPRFPKEIDRSVVRILKERYHRPDPGCAAR